MSALQFKYNCSVLSAELRFVPSHVIKRHIDTTITDSRKNTDFAHATEQKHFHSCQQFTVNKSRHLMALSEL